MTDCYEIVHYRAAFKPQVVELQRYLWSSDLALNGQYLDWKYGQNPYMENPLIVLALHQGVVVAMRGLYGAQWHEGKSGAGFLCPCAGDVVIAPEHRNRGLFTRISSEAVQEAARRGYRYLFNLSAGAVTYWSCLATGWRPLSVLPMLTSGRHTDLGAGDPFESLDFNAATTPPGTGPPITLEAHPRPEAMSRLVERTESDPRLQHVRNREFFAWRFSNPLSRYRFLTWGDGELDGYLTLQSSVNHSKQWLSLIDWAATRPQVFTGLLRRLLEWCRPAEVRVWSETLNASARMRAAA